MPARRRDEILEELGYSSIEQAVREVVRRGLGPHTGARFLGITRQTLKAWADEAGLQLPKRTAPGTGAYQTDLSYMRQACIDKCSTWVDVPGEGRVRLAVLAERLKITRETLRWRIKHWGLEEALKRPVRTSSGRKRSTWSAI